MAIIQHVLRHGHDLLIKEARGVTGPRAILFHPTDRHLLRKCPCPVWMIRPERHAAYQRILAAVDAFSDDEINRDLNLRILELASSQSARSGAELHVVHAYGPISAVLFSPGVDAETRTKAIVDLHRERLDALLAGFPVGDGRVHMEEGRAGDVIAAVARARADRSDRHGYPWAGRDSGAFHRQHGGDHARSRGLRRAGDQAPGIRDARCSFRKTTDVSS